MACAGDDVTPVPQIDGHRGEVPASPDSPSSIAPFPAQSATRARIRRADASIEETVRTVFHPVHSRT